MTCQIRLLLPMTFRRRASVVLPNDSFSSHQPLCWVIITVIEPKNPIAGIRRAIEY